SPGLELRAEGGAAADDLGVEILDADAAAREASGQVAHDPETIVPDELQLHRAATGGHPDRLLLRNDDVYPRRLQSRQGRGERLGVLRRHLEMHEARELTFERGDMAARPVGAEPLRPL